MLKKVLSYAIGFLAGFLTVIPPVPFSIPIMVNSDAWLYIFTFSALAGMMLLFKSIPLALKIFLVYALATSFLSQAPYISFNAFICLVGAYYFFEAGLKVDEQIVFDIIAAAFVLQIMFGVMQLFGKETLYNINRHEPVFVGTVMQYMRFASLLAVMAPILIIKNKWFLVLILISVVISRSCSLGLSVFSGIGVYLFMRFKRYRWLMAGSVFVAMVGYLLWDRASVEIAITDGRVPVWMDILRTWTFDTRACDIPVARNFVNCPIDYKSIFFGRGMDTFLYLFPIFKHDPCPFPQAHCDPMQILWEFGYAGFVILGAYVVNLMYRLRHSVLHISGLVCVLVNMIFTFPMRMVQSMLLLVFFLAYCEKTAREIALEGVHHAC
jgi:hypothetical protein